MDFIRYLPPLIVSSAVFLVAFKVPKEDLKPLLTQLMIICGIVGGVGSLAYMIHPLLTR